MNIAASLRAKEDEMDEETGNKCAPEGHVYVCGACGKVSRWRYGFGDDNRNDATPGWDASCMLNCGLVPVDKIVEPAAWEYPQRVMKIGA